MVAHSEDYGSLLKKFNDYTGAFVEIEATSKSKTLTHEEKLVLLHLKQDRAIEELRKRTNLSNYDLLSTLDRLLEREIIKSVPMRTDEEVQEEADDSTHPSEAAKAAMPPGPSLESSAPVRTEGYSLQSSSNGKILFLVARLIKSIDEYGVDHAEVIRIAEELTRRVRLDTAEGKSLAIHIDAQNGIIVGDRFSLDQDIYNSLATLMGERGLEGFQLDGKLTRVSLLKFLQQLKRSPHFIQQDGGMDIFRQDHDIQGIDVMSSSHHTRMITQQGHSEIGSAPAELAEVRQVIQEFKGFLERMFYNPQVFATLFEAYTRDISIRGADDIVPADELTEVIGEIEQQIGRASCMERV